jgi:hypothetical protein
VIGPTNLEFRDEDESAHYRDSFYNERLGDMFGVAYVSPEQLGDLLWVQEREAAAVKGEMN